MSGSDVLRVLSDRQPACVLGVSWLSPAVLRELTWDRGVEHEDEMLETVVVALGCDIAFVDSAYPWAARATAALAGEGVVVAWSVAGVLGRLAAVIGLSDVIKASAVAPDSLVPHLQAAERTMLDSVSDGVAAGAQAIVIADDLAGPSGWLVSPDFAMQALVPCYALGASIAVDAGALPILHSDGDVRVLYPALAAARFAAIHVGGAGREGIEAAIPAAGRSNLALLGGIQVGSLAHEGARHMGERLATVARSAPLVICDDGGVSSASEVAAIASVLDAARSAWDVGGGGR